ncbi:MAG: hypothetical protein RLN79_07965 [Cytophagales bacterium]
MKNYKHKKALFFLSLFFIAWVSLTVWLNVEHKKEISIISKSNDLALKVTHTSDILISSYVTDYPEIHEKAMKKYSSQIAELKLMREELESLWPKTPSTLLSAIDEAQSSFDDLQSNTDSYVLHEKFSNSNVFFKNMAYHEYSLARRDMLHKNLPLFLILSLILLLGVRYLQSTDMTWILKGTKQVSRSFTSL